MVRFSVAVALFAALVVCLSSPLQVSAQVACECQGTAGQYETCVAYAQKNTNVCLIKGPTVQTEAAKPTCTPPVGGSLRWSTHFQQWFVDACIVPVGVQGFSNSAGSTVVPNVFVALALGLALIIRQ
jgi:hypothetical protein